MLIKPFVSKKEKGRVNILPSNEIDYQTNHPAYFGTPEEKAESIEVEGRLLKLPIMYIEYNIMTNKKIHDNYCGVQWAVCECRFAKHIRAMDIGLDKFKFEEII